MVPKVAKGGHRKTPHLLMYCDCIALSKLSAKGDPQHTAQCAYRAGCFLCKIGNRLLFDQTQSGQTDQRRETCKKKKAVLLLCTAADTITLNQRWTAPFHLKMSRFILQPPPSTVQLPSAICWVTPPFPPTAVGYAPTTVGLTLS